MPGKYHPLFDSNAGDITLRSAEGTLYRVPSNVLKTTSGLFRTMLSLPQGQHPIEPVEVYEKDCVIERILQLMCGMEIPKWRSFDEMENVITLADKWDALGPLSVIRSAITAPSCLAHPIRLYGLARRFGWEEEAKLASTYTLKLTLYDTNLQSQLESLSPADLLILFRFHRLRRDRFQSSIDERETFPAGNDPTYSCPGCHKSLDNHSWREFKTKMLSEMDRRPSGDWFSGLELQEWPEAQAVWAALCSEEGCGRSNYAKGTTLSRLKDCINNLPTTI